MRRLPAYFLLALTLGCGGGGGGTNTTGSTGGSNTSRPTLSNGGGSAPPLVPRILQWVNQGSVVTPRVDLGIQARSVAHGYIPQISVDGRYVTFASPDQDLVAGDRYGTSDVFLWDRETRQLQRIDALDNDPRFPEGVNFYALSDDRRWVAVNSQGFEVPPRLFLLDTSTRQVIDPGINGFGEDISPDGRYTAYWTTPTPTRIYLYDRLTQQSIAITPQGDGNTIGGRFSPDGSLYYFGSEATNLVPGDLNGVRDIFSYRLSDGQISLVSVHPDGTQFNGHSYGARSSNDGRYLVFTSEANNVVPGDSNGVADVFLKDTVTGTFQLVSRGLQGPANGDSGFCSISGDGRTVAFNSKASNLVEHDTNRFSDAFLFDRVQNRVLGRISLTDERLEATGDDDNFRTTEISRDGNWVAFHTQARNMVAGIVGGSANIFLTNSQIPELYQPPGPHPNPYQYVFSGTASVDPTPFDVSGTYSAAGSIQPPAVQPTVIQVVVALQSGTLYRELQFFIHWPRGLEVGSTLTLPDPNGNSVIYQEVDQVSHVPVNFRSGSQGRLTITSLTRSGTGGTVGIRLDDWEMVPNPGFPASTGSFRINGTLTFNIP